MSCFTLPQETTGGFLEDSPAISVRESGAELLGELCRASALETLRYVALHHGLDGGPAGALNGYPSGQSCADIDAVFGWQKFPKAATGTKN